MSPGLTEMPDSEHNLGQVAIASRMAKFAGVKTEDKTALQGRVLKVMHVTNRMALGGTEKVVLKLVENLSQGFEHQVCCVRQCDSDFVESRLRPEQLRALDLPSSRFAVFVPHLVKAIRSCKPHIVHSRNWGAIEAVFAARLAGVPVVVHSEHGYELDILDRTSRRQQWVRRLVCSAADAFVTVSRELRDFHAQEAGVSAKRIRVVYNGVDTELFAPRPDIRMRVRADLGITPDEFVVAAIGRMVPIKNYETLVRSAAILAENNLGFKLVLIGDGPELPRLVALADSFPGVRPRLLALGTRDDIPELLTAADVFVQTSLREGLSNTVLEAMSTGIPAVVTRVGGNPEIVDDGMNGWLFQPGDAQHLAQLLLRLASNREGCRTQGVAARRHVQENFSNATMIESYRTLYMELARKRKCI